MALTLDPSPGGAAANSYVDADEAAAYFEARMNTAAWDVADAAARGRALVAATARLEQEGYVGARATTAQRLKWPRRDVVDEDGMLPYPSDVVPRRVREACCELALHLLVAGATDPLAASGLEAFAGLSLGALDLTPNPNAPPPGALPAQVLRLLRGLLTTSVGVTRLGRA